MQIKIKNYSGRNPEITGIDILNSDVFSYKLEIRNTGFTQIKTVI